ncbi:uncharacterized protein [Lepisosteus oculatus]|uniref:uncharacterized protein n=1 Tax=Lepisosteus oculatus TaxID=7918 RepID=UPI0035F51399
MIDGQAVTSQQSEIKKIQVVALSVGKVHIQVDRKHIDEEDYVKLRCGAERGTRCYFYIDQNPNHIRSEPFREEYKVCVLRVSGKELQEEKGTGISTEVSLSCAVELESEEQMITSSHSEKIRIKVEAKFGRLRIDMDLKRINADQNATIRCEAERGTRCHFYTDESEAPFKSVPFREQYKVCFLTLSGKELLGQRGTGNKTEVVLSCAVELGTLGQTSTSQRSKSITVEVEGLPKSNITDTEPNGPGQLCKTFVWVAAGELVSLMATPVLSCLYFKHKAAVQRDI